MSKKRFTEGLESLFADAPDELQAAEHRKPASSTKKRKAKSNREEGKVSGKDFSSDLASFLQEAFEESFEMQLRKEKAKEPSADAGGAKSGPLTKNSGLDALIRNTLEPVSMTIDPHATRRLVVSFNESQLNKLKTIARLEKTVLKKIISEIVEEYIRKYERDQGEI